jgi:hypothetical protein
MVGAETGSNLGLRKNGQSGYYPPSRGMTLPGFNALTSFLKSDENG